MEVKIGMQSVPRELVIETDSAFDEVERSLTAAVADGGIFVLEDQKGGKIMVPTDKIAYVQIGAAENRRIGFGNA